MSLTTNGKQLLPYIENILNAEADFNDALLRIDSIANGSLLIGAYKSISIKWLPKIIQKFLADYPKVKINVQQGSSEYLEKSLQKNSIDFAFTSYRERAEFEWIDLMDDQLMVVLPTNHELANYSEIPFNFLKTNQFIGSSVDYEYDINKILQQYGISQRHISVYTNDEETTIEMVKQGLGVGLLFESYIAKKIPKSLVVKPINPSVSRRLGIALRKDELDLPIVKKFIEHTKILTR